MLQSPSLEMPLAFPDAAPGAVAVKSAADRPGTIVSPSAKAEIAVFMAGFEGAAIPPFHPTAAPDTVLECRSMRFRSTPPLPDPGQRPTQGDLDGNILALV